MFGTIAIVLAAAALGAAGFAIMRASKMNANVMDLGRRVLDSQDISRITEAVSKAETFESRIAGSERKAEDCQKQLAEQKTKLSELAAKAESAEQAGKKNETCLAELIPNVKALADEIQTIKKFQSATEKVHDLIRSALSDVQSSITPRDSFVTPLDAAKPKEACDGPGEWWQAGDNGNITNK